MSFAGSLCNPFVHSMNKVTPFMTTQNIRQELEGRDFTVLASEEINVLSEELNAEITKESFTNIDLLKKMVKISQQHFNPSDLPRGFFKKWAYTAISILLIPAYLYPVMRLIKLRNLAIKTFRHFNVSVNRSWELNEAGGLLYNIVDDINAVKRLFSEGWPIPPKLLSASISKAISLNHFECVEFLLSKMNIKDDISGFFEIACLAFRKNDLGLIKLILSEDRVKSIRNIPFKESGIKEGTLLENLILYGLTANSDLTFLCFDDLNISLHSFHSFLFACVRNGNLLNLKHLLKTSLPVPQRIRDVAFIMASGEHQEEIRDLLRVMVVIRDADSAPERGFAIRLEDIKINPWHHLDLIISEKFPKRMDVVDSPVVDYGGVTNQVLTILSGSLETELKLTSTKMPLVEQDDSDKESKLCRFQKLGKLFSLLEKRNESRTRNFFILDNLFSSQFYKIIKILALMDSEGPQTQDTLLKRVASENLDGTEESLSLASKVISQRASSIENETFKEAFSCSDEEMHSLASNTIMSYIIPAQAFYENLDDEVKFLFLFQSVETLVTRFQGEEASAKQIIDRIQLPNSTEHLEKQTDWIKEKIKESDLEWRKKFLTAVTGRTQISSDSVFTFETVENQQGLVFQSHTCSNTLDLPKPQEPEISKEDFLAALEIFLDEKELNAV